MTHEELATNLKALGLMTMLSQYVETAKAAEKKKSTYEQYLSFLAKAELDAKSHARRQRLIQEAKLPRSKRIETYNWENREGISLAEFNRLATGDFLKEASNIVFYGGLGVGKSHLAEALILKLCELGKRCYFTSTHMLIEQMIDAKKNLTLTQLLKKLDRYDFLVLDELGYLPQTRDGADLLFQLISQRDERKSILITTNLTYAEWDRVFVNPLNTAAAVDRIIHKCETFNIQGPSWRSETAKKRQTKQKELTVQTETNKPSPSIGQI
jgi:DNA replication protein DnaC